MANKRQYFYCIDPPAEVNLGKYSVTFDNAASAIEQGQDPKQNLLVDCSYFTTTGHLVYLQKHDAKFDAACQSYATPLVQELEAQLPTEIFDQEYLLDEWIHKRQIPSHSDEVALRIGVFDGFEERPIYSCVQMGALQALRKHLKARHINAEITCFVFNQARCRMFQEGRNDFAWQPLPVRMDSVMQQDLLLDFQMPKSTGVNSLTDYYLMVVGLHDQVPHARKMTEFSISEQRKKDVAQLMGLDTELPGVLVHFDVEPKQKLHSNLIAKLDNVLVNGRGKMRCVAVDFGSGRKAGVRYYAVGKLSLRNYIELAPLVEIMITNNELCAKLCESFAKPCIYINDTLPKSLSAMQRIYPIVDNDSSTFLEQLADIDLTELAQELISRYSNRLQASADKVS